VVRIGVVDAHEYGEPRGLRRTSIGCHDSPISQDELHPMRPDAKAHGEPERTAQPVTRHDRVVVREDRDDRRRRHGAVLDHAPFPSRTSCKTQVLPSGSSKSAKDA
jgi:hypothetical protein